MHAEAEREGAPALFTCAEHGFRTDSMTEAQQHLLEHLGIAEISVEPR